MFWTARNDCCTQNCEKKHDMTKVKNLWEQIAFVMDNETRSVTIKRLCFAVLCDVESTKWLFRRVGKQCECEYNCIEHKKVLGVTPYGQSVWMQFIWPMTAPYPLGWRLKNVVHSSSLIEVSTSRSNLQQLKGNFCRLCSRRWSMFSNTGRRSSVSF